MSGPSQDAPGERQARWEGEPVGVWEERWAIPALEVWSRLGSTNDRARQLARAGSPPFTVVLAEEQTAGRGRGGRSWASAAGMGLWMSVLLRAPVPEGMPLVPLLVGLATSRATERTAGATKALLKWPNDVLIHGRKVAGVLCEGAGDQTLVAGIGVNVRQTEEDFPPGLRASAVSLEGSGGAPVARAALAGALLVELRGLLAQPVLRLDGALAEEIARRDALRGRRVAVEGGVVGRALGIDPRGRLSLETDAGEIRAVVAGSVVPLSEADEVGSSDGVGRR